MIVFIFFINCFVLGSNVFKEGEETELDLEKHHSFIGSCQSGLWLDLEETLL